MTIKDAIPQRHMVRKYLSKPILAETVTLLNIRSQCEIWFKLEIGHWEL